MGGPKSGVSGDVWWVVCWETGWVVGAPGAHSFGRMLWMSISALLMGCLVGAQLEEGNQSFDTGTSSLSLLIIFMGDRISKQP